MNHPGVINIEDLIPAAGDEVEEWITDRMVPFLQQRDIIDLGPNAFAEVGPAGTSVEFRVPPAFRGRFVVAVDGIRARVTEGLFNEVFTPTIDGVFLDGTNQITGKQGDVPAVTIVPPAQPFRGLFSFVCLVVKVDAANGQPLVDDPDFLTIQHIIDLDKERRERNPGEGFRALARLRWENDIVVKTTQIANHDIIHYFVEGEDESPGFHFFDGL